MTRGTALFCLMVVLLPAVARAEDPLPADLPPADFDQRLNEPVPLDTTFRDELNRTVRLGDFFDGKPVILVLAYYRCPMLCTQVLNGLVDCLRGVPMNAGQQFQVVVVSFDAREKPALAVAKRATYLEEYGRPGTDGGWHFLTGPQASIDRLTEAVGFHYTYDAKRDQFAHRSGLIVVTPQGKISRYFPGIDYRPADVRLSLVDASGGKIGTPSDQLFLLCFHYDPIAGKYTPTIMSFLRLGGVLTLSALGLFLVCAWRRDWLQRRKTVL